MFIRFITHRLDEDSGRRQGIFHAMADLKDNDELPDHDLKIYEEIYEWFRHNLKKPNSFSRSKKTH